LEQGVAPFFMPILQIAFAFLFLVHLSITL
jgi:hypothetical protein